MVTATIPMRSGTGALAIGPTSSTDLALQHLRSLHLLGYRVFDGAH